MSSAKRLATALATVAAFTVANAATAQAAAGWRQDPAPVASGNVLAMTQVDKHTTWAAGFVLTTTDGQGLTPMLLARDDRAGTGWTRVATPADTLSSRINGLSAANAHDVWLVGDNDPTANGPVLTEHWDGKAWRIAEAPVPDGTVSAGFLGVATVNPRDAWAVGWTQRWRGDVTYDTGLIEHWDGKAWTQTKLPATVPDAMLMSVTATGPHDVWAAGVIADGTDQPVLLHYNGKTWSRAAITDTGLYGEFNTIVASAPNDVWAAGRTIVDDKDRGHPLVAHYDGHSWKTVKTPGTGVVFAAAPTPGGVAVVGYDKNNGQPYGEQLDGHGWHSLGLPTVGIDSSPYSMVATSRGITVGGAYDPDETSPFQALLLTSER